MDFDGQTSSRHEMSQCSQECLSGEIADNLKVDSFGDKADKDSNVCFHQDRLPSVSTLECEGAVIVYTGHGKWR